MTTVAALVGIAVAAMLLLSVAALMLGILDSAQSGAWRRIAAQRRETWERRQYAHRRGGHVEAWADQDDL